MRPIDLARLPCPQNSLCSVRTHTALLSLSQRDTLYPQRLLTRFTYDTTSHNLLQCALEI